MLMISMILHLQIMTVLPCTREANLLGCLKSRTTPDQAEYYWRLVERREVSCLQELLVSAVRHS